MYCVSSRRTVTGMNDVCDECRLYGDDYSYDRDGDLVSNCYDCPLRRLEGWNDEDD